MFTIASTGITVGGMCGSLAAGFISDRYFKSRRAPVILMFFVLQALTLVGLHVSNRSTPGLAVASTTIYSMAVFGVVTSILGTSADFVGTKRAGTASGLLNAMQYVGSSTGSFVTGWVV